MWNDIRQAMAYFNSLQLRERMQGAGVMGPREFLYMGEVDQVPV